MGTIDPGLFVVSGRVREGVTLDRAEAEVDAIFKEIVTRGPLESELEKVKNQAYSTLEFGEVEVMNRAMNLAFAKLSGDADLVNKEGAMINKVSLADIQRVASQILNDENSSVMYYHASN
jgi:zinc protease